MKNFTKKVKKVVDKKDFRGYDGIKIKTRRKDGQGRKGRNTWKQKTPRGGGDVL